MRFAANLDVSRTELNIEDEMNIETNKPYKIFAEVLEQGALDQFQSAMNCDFATRGALMPDAQVALMKVKCPQGTAGLSLSRRKSIGRKPGRLRRVRYS